MANYTGQTTAWNGFKNQVGAWIDWVIERKPDFEKRTTEQKQAWIESNNDPILTLAFWLYKNILHDMFEDLVEQSDSTNPLDKATGK